VLNKTRGGPQRSCAGALANGTGRRVCPREPLDDAALVEVMPRAFQRPHHVGDVAVAQVFEADCARIVLAPHRFDAFHQAFRVHSSFLAATTGTGAGGAVTGTGTPGLRCSHVIQALAAIRIGIALDPQQKDESYHAEHEHPRGADHEAHASVAQREVIRRRQPCAQYEEDPAAQRQHAAGANDTKSYP